MELDTRGANAGSSNYKICDLGQVRRAFEITVS